MANRNYPWDTPDPFGLGPDSDGERAPRRAGRGLWLLLVIAFFLAAVVGFANCAKAGPVPCDAQAAQLSPPVQRPLAPPVQVPKARTQAKEAAPAPRPVVGLADCAVLVRCPDGSTGSGWCVACEGGRSLVLTNSHVCGRPREWVTVVHGGAAHRGYVVCSEGRTVGADIAAVVVYAGLPCTPPADTDPAPDAPLTRYGFPWHTQGRLLPKAARFLGFRGSKEPSGAAIVDMTTPSESGESGSGVVAGGRLVGITWGNRGFKGVDEVGTMVGLADVRRVCHRAAKANGFKALAAATAGADLPGGPVQDPPPQRMPSPQSNGA